ncbi:MAG: conjugal transfer protein TrbM [Candidatus Accumulibacter sp.]|uniref:Conjugal transfer protein TrbM n=1 Tax=Candidatus Accumulibacter proximus TaxID=2954385 RepID=A0A935UJ86_9PROT|nr:conjugal transfer protein TrbM [Candidatus Accumulibacter proximus]
MKNHCLLAPFALAIAAVVAAPAGAQEVLTGDTRLACEATLCLATGTRPGECAPSLSRYFSIHKRKWSDTVRARASFLSLCPVSDQTPEMRALVGAMANGAGRCDAASLNVTLRVWNHADGGRVFINNQMPGYCAAYTGHQYTNPGDLAPGYVGTPERGGYWVDARDQDAALARYNDRIAAEDSRRRNDEWYR